MYESQVHTIYHLRPSSARNHKHIARTDKATTNLLLPNEGLGSKSWEVVYDATGRKKVCHGSYLLCDAGGYHRWPCLVYPVKTGLPGSPSRKWAAMLESVRKDVEGLFDILKSCFVILKHINRMHHQRNVDNVRAICCILVRPPGTRDLYLYQVATLDN